MSNALMKEHLLSLGVQFNERSRVSCPVCGPERKKRNERTLSVRIDGDTAVYMCHHCEEKGSIKLDDETSFPSLDEALTETKRKVIPIKEKPYEFLQENQLEWLSSRGISEDTARQCDLISDSIWIRRRKEEVSCIGFKYNNEDGSTAVKWRDGDKNFTQTGVAKSLWRLDEFDGGDLIITEGEMDAISFAEIGAFATSAPNGAPAKLSDDLSVSREADSKKYSYLWDSKECISKAKRVVIATDGDTPGRNLAEEIARRIGKGKCWRLEYPDGCKDANDVLMKLGPDALKDVLKAAIPWPIGGLRTAREYKEQALSLYRDGMTRGVDTGIPALSSIYKPSPQTLTIVTGIPGSGKSTFLTWLSMQLAINHDWPCAVFAAETSSEVHILQLAALYKKQAFHGDHKMTEDDLSDAIDWVSDHFVFLDEASTSIESILERGQAAVMRNGAKLLMIDPYNFITVDSSSNENDTNTITKMLVKLKGFAIQHDVAVQLVAHPRMMYRVSGQNSTPGGYDVSGSAGFFNVADNGLTVERVQGEFNVSRIVSWKSRFPWIGSTGDVQLNFNAETGSYSSRIDHPWEADEDWDI